MQLRNERPVVSVKVVASGAFTGGTSKAPASQGATESKEEEEKVSNNNEGKEP